MKITVILCTYNRCRSLAKALESLAVSQVPKSLEWEVLVVDNNSSDHTPAVVEELCCRYPGRFRYVFEPEPGLSHARNAGIREARGDILAFTDDDVMVEPTWLRNLTAHLHRNEWAGVGGRILPERSFSPPRWLSLNGKHRMLGVLALLDYGDKPGDLDEPPWGANMAFRKEMFKKYGKFRTDLGRRPSSLIGDEDTEFGQRLMVAGERLRYEPSAVVYHVILEQRAKKDYFLRWSFDRGRAEIRVRGERPGRWAIPRYYFSIGRLALIMLRWMRTLDTPTRFFWKCQVWMHAGKVVENYHQSRHGKRRNPIELPNS